MSFCDTRAIGLCPVCREDWVATRDKTDGSYRCQTCYAVRIEATRRPPAHGELVWVRRIVDEHGREVGRVE